MRAAILLAVLASMPATASTSIPGLPASRPPALASSSRTAALFTCPQGHGEHVPVPTRRQALSTCLQTPGAQTCFLRRGAAHAYPDPSPRYPDADDQQPFDPHALEILHRMAGAYARLEALDQRTEFTYTMAPIKPAGSPASSSPRRQGANDRGRTVDNGGRSTGAPAGAESGSRRVLRLAFRQPNQLLLELNETDIGTGKISTTRWGSDGKTFWTYDSANNWYTREKAPGSIRDFSRLSGLGGGSLELLMLMGLDPFVAVKTQSDSVGYMGTEILGGETTEVVTIRTTRGEQKIETRLYIGKDDLLLRRMVNETVPIPTPNTPGKVGDPLDELIPNAPSQPRSSADSPADDSSGPMRTQAVSDTTIQPPPAFDRHTFAFLVPSNATLYIPNGQPHVKVRTLKERIADMVKAMRRDKSSH